VLHFSRRSENSQCVQFHVIFDEADPEAELHSEDELDSPILEEEEEEEEPDNGPHHEPMHDPDYDEQPIGHGSNYTPS